MDLFFRLLSVPRHWRVLGAKCCLLALSFVRADVSLAQTSDSGCDRNAGSETPEYLLDLANCQLRQGLTGDALETLKTGLDLAQSQGDPGLRSAFAGQRGRVLLQQGAALEAESDLVQAIEALPAEDSGDRRTALLIDLAAARALQDKYAEGAEAFGQAAALADASNNGELFVVASLGQARAQLDAGQLTASQATLDEVWKARQSSQTAASQPTEQLLIMGELYHRVDATGGAARNAARALELLTLAAEQARRDGDVRAESFALGYLGAMAERYGDDAKALAYSRLAVNKAREANALDGLYQWQWQSARILEHQGRPVLAITAYQQAIATLEQIRPELARGSSQSFQRAVAPVFFGLANLLLQSPSAIDDSASESARLRLVRSTIETLKVAEIQDYFDNDCVVRAEEAAPLDELASNTAVIYPIIFDNRLEILVSQGAKISRYTVAVDRRTLTETVRQFRLNLERRPTHRYRAHGEKLYDWLVRPELAELRAANVSTLIFVPDGPLRGIPPAALYDGSRFLIEEFSVSTTLGVTLTSPRPIARDSGARVLAGGLTVGAEGFSPLPGVATELERVKQIFGATELRDSKFGVKPLTRELSAGDYSIVHIATHGQFTRDYRQSFLLAYDGRINMNLLEETVGLRRYRTQPVELLMLSACETAAGDDRAALGLAGVALKAGARSAVATLWSVYDEATAVLVGRFYEQLEDRSFSKAEALRQAQLSLLADQRYAHPAVWSPFLLIGNWL